MKRITAAIMAVVLLLMLAGCTADTYLYASRDGDWSIKIPKEFKKEKEEAYEELKSYSVTYKTENESYLVINEMIDEKLVINEETLKEEIAEINYFHAEGYNTLDIEGFGKAYGVLVFDESIGTTMLYYRLKHKDKAISFIIYRQGSFTADQIKKGADMIGTFKAK
jgi:hypothetical protein